MSLSSWFHCCMYSGHDSNKCWCCVMQILALGMRAHPNAPSFKTLHVPLTKGCHAKRLDVSLHNSSSRKRLPVMELRMSPRACVMSSFVPLKRPTTEAYINSPHHTHNAYLQPSCIAEWFRTHVRLCLGSRRRLVHFCMTAAYRCWMDLLESNNYFLFWQTGNWWKRENIWLAAVN